MNYFKNKILQSTRWTLAAILATCLLVGFYRTPVKAAESGQAGGSITWKFENGTLTLTGSGAMYHFSEPNMAPWYHLREQIIQVNIEDGIQGIGDLAFYGCSALERVSLPESITSVGELSFAACVKLKNVYFGSNLKSIADQAFERCESLVFVQLPDGLLNIGYQAFYRCSSLTSIRIPSTVSNLGSNIFGYCTSLMQVVIDSPITTLPEWTFYGCSSLQNVSLPSSLQNIGSNAFEGCDSLQNAYHDGNNSDRLEIEEQIQESVPNFSGVSEGNSSNIITSTGSNHEEKDDGTTIDTRLEVTESDNSNITVKVENKKPQDITIDNKEEYSIIINATVENKDGWQEVIDKVKEYTNYPERFANQTTEVNRIQVNVSLKDGLEVPTKIVSALAGEKVDINISSPNQMDWTIDCEYLDVKKVSGSYDLSYWMVLNENPTKAQKELIKDAESYNLRFSQDIPFYTSVRISIRTTLYKEFATLCWSKSGKNWEVLQSVVIDSSGCATFYLDAIDKSAKYLIAINMEGVSFENALIPESMYGELGVYMDDQGKRYVITGAASSLNISFWQLSLILLGVIILSVGVIGIIMLMRQKTVNNTKN